jgi:hypothetical protein
VTYIQSGLLGPGYLNSAVVDDPTSLAAAIADASIFQIGVSGEITLTGAATIPDTKTFVMPQGSKIICDGNTLTINGRIEAGNYEIFEADSGDVIIPNGSSESYLASLMDSTYVSHRNNTLNAIWFNGGGDIGVSINKAFAAGGTGTHATVPSGIYKLSTSIDMGFTNHLVLSGQGQIATTLQIENITGGIAGIKLGGSSAENEMRNIRVTEISGSTKSICCLVAGTTSKITNCWFGNAAVGIMMTGAAGAAIESTTVEGCLTNVLLASRGGYGNIVQDEGGALSDIRFNSCMFTGGGTTNQSVDGYSVWIEPFTRLEIDSLTGGFMDKGDVITGATSGATATVMGYNSTLGYLYIFNVSGTFQDAETINADTESANIVSRQSNAITNVRFVNCITKLSNESGVRVHGNVSRLQYNGSCRLNDVYDFEIGDGADIAINGVEFDGAVNTSVVIVDSSAKIIGCGFNPSSDIVCVDATDSDLIVVGCDASGLTDAITTSGGTLTQAGNRGVWS